MSARFAVVVHRIVKKFFGLARIDQQRTGLHGSFDEGEHGAPVFLAVDLSERLLALADAQR